jgi:hypothetical protein
MLRFCLERSEEKRMYSFFNYRRFAIANRGLSPNFHIHVSVSELYIPTMGLPFLLEEICGLILGKSLTGT